MTGLSQVQQSWCNQLAKGALTGASALGDILVLAAKCQNSSVPASLASVDFSGQTAPAPPGQYLGMPNSVWSNLLAALGALETALESTVPNTTVTIEQAFQQAADYAAQ